MYLSRMRLDAVNCVRICWPERVGAFVVHFLLCPHILFRFEFAVGV